MEGKVGAAAKIVAKALHPHFLREEEIATPLLGLLRPLAGDETPQEIEKAIEMAGQLKAEMPRMLEEHHAIVTALADLAKAIELEGVKEGRDFPEKLKQHATIEEDVFYPAAILVGEHIKLKYPKASILA